MTIEPLEPQIKGPEVAAGLPDSVKSDAKLSAKPKVLHESIFWDEDDHRRKLTGIGVVNGNHDIDQQYVDMEHDAYIWAFTGSRGAGKTLGMTYYAGKAVYLYNARLVSNYPIEFILKRIDGTSQYVKAEALDLYKLLCFDKDYQHCVILIDEAPDIISHLSAMTWKNRLLNIFVRQLRKNMNTLIMGAQQLSLIDKSMRWQTDIVVRCQDAFRLYGASSGLCRGACILLDMYDNSGQWTGHGKNIAYDAQLDMYDADDSIELPGTVVWGAYDTYYEQDIFESLKKVDANFGSYKVGPKQEKGLDVEVLKKAMPFIERQVDSDKTNMAKFYRDAGITTPRDKRVLGMLFRENGLEDCGRNGWANFSGVDCERLRTLISTAGESEA